MRQLFCDSEFHAYAINRRILKFALQVLFYSGIEGREISSFNGIEVKNLKKNYRISGTKEKFNYRINPGRYFSFSPAWIIF